MPRCRPLRCALAATFALVAASGVVAVQPAARADAVASQQPASFQALPAPARLADTRSVGVTIDGAYAAIGARSVGETLALAVAGRAGVPDAASVVALNVTVAAPDAVGYVTVWPCTQPRPVASTLNYAPGATVAALAFVAVDSLGLACIYTHGTVELIVDVTGSFGAGDLAMLPAPRRLLDTRPGASTYDGLELGAGALGAGGVRRVPIAGRAGIPAGIGDALVTVTADAAAGAGYLTAWSCDSQQPNTSTLNVAAGGTAANVAVVHLDAGGGLCLYSSMATHALVDVAGWVAPSASPAIRTLAAPQRLLDTRAGASTIDGRNLGAGARLPGATLALPVAGRGDIPAGAGAALLNVTAVAAHDRSWVTVHPGGSGRPNASNLNTAPGATVANLVVSTLGADGVACLFTAGRSDLVVDVVGWLPGAAPGPATGCPRATVFPDQRIVAMYGNDAAAALGVLGEQAPEQAAVRAEQFAAGFANSDRPVVPSFELIATVAAGSPGGDGLYRSPSSFDTVQRYLDVARAHGFWLILDIQPGRSDFLTELRRYEPFLHDPNVGVALDPEWRVGPDEVPGQVIGQVSAAEINAVADYLSGIVVADGLPEKPFLVHQFQTRMITDRATLREPPGLAVTIHMDGFGNRAQKLDTYAYVHADPPLSNGFKLFIDEDLAMFSPDEVLRLSPTVDVITYQ